MDKKKITLAAAAALATTGVLANEAKADNVETTPAQVQPEAQATTQASVDAAKANLDSAAENVAQTQKDVDQAKANLDSAQQSKNMTQAEKDEALQQEKSDLASQKEETAKNQTAEKAAQDALTKAQAEQEKVSATLNNAQQEKTVPSLGFTEQQRAAAQKFVSEYAKKMKEMDYERASILDTIVNNKNDDYFASDTLKNSYKGLVNTLMNSENNPSWKDTNTDDLNTTVDLDNLTREQVVDLSLFTAQLYNQMLKDLGIDGMVSNYEVTEGGVDLIRSSMQNNRGKIKSEVFDNDDDVFDYGLNHAESTGALHQLGASVEKPNHKATMADMKEAMFKQLVSVMFESPNENHFGGVEDGSPLTTALNVDSISKNSIAKEYLASNTIAVNNSNKFLPITFTYSDRMIYGYDGNAMDKAIEKKMNVVINNPYKLGSTTLTDGLAKQVEEANKQVEEAKSQLDSAKEAVKQSQAKEAKAQQTIAALENQNPKSVEEAQKAYDEAVAKNEEAKANQVQAQKAYDDALAALNSQTKSDEVAAVVKGDSNKLVLSTPKTTDSKDVSSSVVVTPVVKHETSKAAVVNNNNQAVKTATLPQTGEAQSSATMAGVVLTAFSAMLGFGLARKEK